jgi:RNA recognition motif-containing protein
MKLYVGNLDYSTTEHSLQELFEEFGEVVNATIINDRDTGRSKGFGFIEMASKNDGIKAISKLDGQEINGRELKVNEAQPKQAGGGNRGRKW